MTSADPRVAVVVITRDRRVDLLRTLRELERLPERPRIAVVDNGSCDGTADAVRREHPDVALIALGENLGAAARTVAIERLEAPYVALTDDDSWWEPGALRRAADLLDAHPRLALVNGHVLVGDDEHDDPIAAEMAASPLPLAPGQPGHRLLSFQACAAVVRRDAYLAAGGFRPELAVGGEEEILGWDLASAGWLMSYVPEVVAHHHPSAGRDAHDRRAIGIRNTLWTTWLRRPLRPALSRTAWLLRTVPRDAVSARGILWALAGAPRILRHRAPSPPEVEAMRRQLDAQQRASTARRYVS